MNTDRYLILAYAALVMGNEQDAIARLKSAATLTANPMRWLRIRRALRLLKRIQAKGKRIDAWFKRIPREHQSWDYDRYSR